MRASRGGLARLGTALALWAMTAALAAPDPTDGDIAPSAVEPWRVRFDAAVPRALHPPPSAWMDYAARARDALARAGRPITSTQWVLVVDRSEHVQAALLMLAQPVPAPWWPLGAAPVATGRPGAFEHFLTPLGVFEHGLAALDFRAEGTVNAHGIRGYGERGLRVYDFGWVMAVRTWDRRGESPMRLQVHATDPDRLEPLLGQRGSKGCIRIPAAMNRFMDRHGLLDAAYDEALARGQRFWMLPAERQPTPWPGRWLVVLDSGVAERPGWSPLPGQAPAPRGTEAAGAAPIAGC